MLYRETAMHHVLLVIVLSSHVGYSLSHTSSDSSQKHGSHNLLKSVQRAARCTPCEDSFKKPVSNHLDPDFRGNGADNLGYDWSSMAWGGLAYPRRSKLYMEGMPGRGGRMMTPSDWGRNQGNMRVVCDTCRTYWDGNANGGRDTGRGSGGNGWQFDGRGGRNFYSGQPDYWQGDKTRPPGDFETRVMSPTVGVLVKPGSRIAYIPSRSGEMYWDGVSGGGTRWDGFSNGISWVGANGPEWDRSDPGPRDEKPGYDSGSSRPGGDYPFGSSGFGMKRPWGDGMGRGYYFTNGVPNDIDPQWRDRGYASNWHYGSTNQNGWNGNNMKWNYGGKQWADNDRAANRFYFNTPQDRNYGPTDGRPQLYGNQYPNYQSGGGYPQGFRPQPSWTSSGGGFRPNDRFPASFPQGSTGSGDKDKPWDYSSRDPPGHRPRPEWIRPGPSYPAPGTFEGGSGRFPGNYGGYNKFSPSDRNDFEKPWSRPSGSGYGPSKPSSGGSFPYGGNRYPEEGGGRPGFSVGGGHLFIPNGDNRQPTYPSIDSGNNRPAYQSGNRKPGEYPGSQVGTYPGDGSRPYPDDRRPSIIYTGGRPSGGGEGSSGGYPGGGGSSSGGYPGGGSSSSGYPSSGGSSGGYPSGGGPSGSYPSGGLSGGYPSGGSSSGGYPGSGGSSGSYPGSGSSSGGYPSSGSTSGYPSTESSTGGSGSYPGGIRPGPGYPGPSSGYPSGESSYPSGIGRPGGYPTGGKYPEGGRPGNYVSVGGRPGSYGGGGAPGGYPGTDGSSYPRPGAYPSAGGSSYPGESVRPGSYPDEGYPRPGYFGSSRPTGYPSAERPGGYPGDSGRPDEYPGGGRPGYPTRGQSPYGGSGSGGPGGGYQQGNKPSKGYYMGFITELGPDDGQVQYGGKYPNYFGSGYPGNSYPGKDRDKYFYGGSYPNRPPSGDKNRYPAYSEDRYSGGGGGGGGGGSGYPGSDKDSGYDRGSDKFYYGQTGNKGKYPDGYPSNHRLPGGGNGGDFQNESSNDDKNSWNYGQSERKDGIYRRSGGSYPPYRGGQYYTSSYLASMPTTSGSTQAGTETKTQTVTKADEVTQSTLDST